MSHIKLNLSFVRFDYSAKNWYFSHKIYNATYGYMLTNSERKIVIGTSPAAMTAVSDAL